MLQSDLECVCIPLWYPMGFSNRRNINTGLENNFFLFNLYKYLKTINNRTLWVSPALNQIIYFHYLPLKPTNAPYINLASKHIWKFIIWTFYNVKISDNKFSQCIIYTIVYELFRQVCSISTPIIHA